MLVWIINSTLKVLSATGGKFRWRGTYFNTLHNLPLRVIHIKPCECRIRVAFVVFKLNNLEMGLINDLSEESLEEYLVFGL